MFGGEVVDEPRLVRLLEDVVAHRRALAGQVREIAALAAEELTDSEYGLDLGAWISDRTGRPVWVCRREVRHSVKVVSRFPAVLAALEAGEIGWEHVEVILDAANPRIE